MTRTKSWLSAIIIAGTLALPAAPSFAAPVAGVHNATAPASTAVVEQVRWGGRGRGWGGRGWGIGAGIVGGAILGSALAAPYYYRPYAYYPAPSYYGPGPGGDAVAYCASRFRSYDPRTGTYLGYDGYRHPCP